MKEPFEFKVFQKSNFDEYNDWFKNERIKKALEYIDDEWSEFISNDKTGIEYAIFQGNEMVAVTGLIFPTDKHKSYGIKNIAVNPSYFRKGIGTRVLKKLYELHPLKEGEFWQAFVDKKNYSAQEFFKENNWTMIKNGEAGENMLRFEYHC